MKLFNFSKEGKGIKKEAVSKQFGLIRFFGIISDKIWKILTVNIVFLGVNIPIFGIFAYLANVGGVKFFSPSTVLNQPLHGVMLHGNSPFLTALRGVVGVEIETYYPSNLTKAFLILGILTVFTFGIANCGMTYVFKKFVTDDHADIGSDFFHAIKSNFKQGIAVGIIDVFAVFVILFDLVSYKNTTGSFISLIFFYLTIFISLLYLLMRPFIYLILTTFDIKTVKILKNSSILATIGWKRTVPALLVSVLVFVLNYLIYCYVPALGALLFFIISVSVSWFIQIYASFPVMKKYMIDPFYEEKVPEATEEEAVFTDRG